MNTRAFAKRTPRTHLRVCEYQAMTSGRLVRPTDTVDRAGNVNLGESISTTFATSIAHDDL